MPAINQSKRQSNMELLRMLSILGVLFLHYNNNPAYGSTFDYLSNGSINLIILDLFESFSICAVNVFILISVFFLVKNNSRSLFKPVKLLFEVFFISVVNYVYLVLTKYANAAPLMCLVHVLLTVLAIYLICMVIHMLFTVMTNPVFNRIKPLFDKTKYIIE